jgi:Ser/Thr protein kinase RdoA (MazF antagonist)
VPALFASHAQDEQWVFVLEDLDAAGYPSRRHQLDAIDVQQCLTWLARFHATFLGTAPERLWKTGTYWHLSTRPDELARMTNRRLKTAAAAIDLRLNRAGFQSLVHGDAKLENFCFPMRGASSELGVAAVDFQYVGGGAGIKDVAYFFSSIWESAECEAQAADALDFYFEVLRVALGARLTRSEANALEQEWRTLYPMAWADFSRFLEGWAPGHFERHAYSQRLTEQALTAL